MDILCIKILSLSQSNLGNSPLDTYVVRVRLKVVRVIDGDYLVNGSDVTLYYMYGVQTWLNDNNYNNGIS